MSWAIWITGPPGSGKTTLARAAAATLRAHAVCVKVLELDEVRKVITPTPTYSDAERDVVYRALAYMAKLLAEAGVPVIVDATAHRRAWREAARTLIPVFAEVQLRCPLGIREERERTRRARFVSAGIYSRAGQPGTTVSGVDVAYEDAIAPELSLDTHTCDLATAVEEILYLARRLARYAAFHPPNVAKRPLCN